MAARAATPVRAPVPTQSDESARLEWVIAALLFAIGAAAWAIYFRDGLVLSHYDAKAHLVVARRVLDSVTPGWQQIGAVWLPLPHLINLLPVQIDTLYRTGLFASFVSILCYSATAWAAARLVRRITGSAIGAITAAVLLVNPSLLYLQATPMTEPLLLAVTFLLVLWLFEWLDTGAPGVPRKLGLVLFAATWTRYEAWFVIAAAVLVTALTLWRRGLPLPIATRRCAELAAWPAAAVVIFVINSRITVGAWFVTGGFYVPDPRYQGQALESLVAVVWGTYALSGTVFVAVALITAIALGATTLVRGRRDLHHLAPICLLATAALPLYAFYQGHPFRIRYMIPLVAGGALLNGLAIGWLERALTTRARHSSPDSGSTAGRHAPRRSGVVALAAVALVAATAIESRPWRRQSPLIAEAQWDIPWSEGRQAVTACLSRDYDGNKIFASMGSLAHYMQELSHAGFAIADFIHEGNGEIWQVALETGPAAHAEWLLVEERAEGGDMLAAIIRERPVFLDGMVRVCEGGGVALYRRQR